MGILDKFRKPGITKENLLTTDADIAKNMLNSASNIPIEEKKPLEPPEYRYTVKDVMEAIVEAYTDIKSDISIISNNQLQLSNAILRLEEALDKLKPKK